jgi:predicted nucleic acid-binding Zn ribbon protein
MVNNCFTVLSGFSVTDDAKVWGENPGSRIKNGYFRLYSCIPVYTRIIFMERPKNQVCIECGTEFRGRIDKKFCSDQCRTSYNNKQKSIENTYVKDVNNILRKNRKILVELNPDGKTRVSQEKLKSKGFDFNYYTSTYTTKEGAQYFYCYEQGYLPIEKNLCLLVVKKDYNI